MITFPFFKDQPFISTYVFDTDLGTLQTTSPGSYRLDGGLVSAFIDFGSFGVFGGVFGAAASSPGRMGLALSLHGLVIFPAACGYPCHSIPSASITPSNSVSVPQTWTRRHGDHAVMPRA